MTTTSLKRNSHTENKTDKDTILYYESSPLQLSLVPKHILSLREKSSNVLKDICEIDENNLQNPKNYRDPKYQKRDFSLLLFFSSSILGRCHQLIARSKALFGGDMANTIIIFSYSPAKKAEAS